MAHIAKTKKGVIYLADDWHLEDVQSVRPDLNDEQCADVLESLADNFNANDGINWEVIEAAAESLYPSEAAE